MASQKTHYLRNLFIVLVLMAGFVWAAVWIINRPETLAHALSIANLKSQWQIDVKSFHFNPIKSSIDISGVSAVHKEHGRGIFAKNIHITYRPLGFVRGKIIIDKFYIDEASLELPPAKTRRERKKLDLAQLILLNNIELKDGQIGGLSIAFGKQSHFVLDEARLSMEPSIFGKTSLGLRIDGLFMSKNEKQIVSAGMFKLSTSTVLPEWNEEFPYINSIEGTLKLGDLDYEGVIAQTVDAKVSLLDGALKLEDLALSIDGRELTGGIEADTNEDTFALALDIKEPISLPYIGKKMDTMDTGGAISGGVRLSGSGFIPKETSGKGLVDITHKFNASPDAPLKVVAPITWSNGVIKFTKADIQAGNDSASAAGSIDIVNKHFSFSAEGSNFPLEHVFDKFTNPHLKKIFGPTNFKGTFEGWGKKFMAKVTGETHGGGWRPITADRVDTIFEATYDGLKLSGTIFSPRGETGKADLSIKFGPKTENIDRRKYIDLTASISNHPVESSLAAYGLEGIGTGSITLVGPHIAFKGEVKAEVENGKWHALPFDHASTKIALSRDRLIFSEMELNLRDIASPKIAENVIADIKGNFIKFHGTPVAGLNIDATYRTDNGSWQIGKISWNDPDRPGDSIAATGGMATLGGLNLNVDGRIDLSVISSITPLIRNGTGPVDIDLSIRGTTSDIKPYGQIKFNNNEMSPREARISLENLNGTLVFDGSKIELKGIAAKVDDGDISLGGYVTHQGYRPEHADLNFAGRGMRYRTGDGTLRLELDGNLHLLGPFSNILLAGDITVLDGKYTQDFNIIDAFFSAKRKTKRAIKEAQTVFDPHLDLKIRNTGDLAIRNNVGDIWLNVNVEVKGTRKNPIVSGTIDTADGKIHYLGIDFDVTKGFMEFRERDRAPYIEVYAQKEVGVYNVNLVLFGPTDNLTLDLSAASPTGQIEKRDVVSLILFGATEQERVTFAQQNAGGTMASSVVGQAITGVIGTPISKITHLDVIRFESGTSGTSNISRLYIGKQLTDRLTVNFATDINTNEAVQTVLGEYMVTDNIILKGSRSSDSNYRIGGALRFRLR